jgi:hypothetical protein
MGGGNLSGTVRELIDRLCSFAGRAPCSDAERRAAAWLHDELRRRGHEAWVETHWVRPHWAPSMLLAAALAVAGSVLAPSVPIAGVALAGIAGVSLAIESFGRPGPLRRLLYRRATQNVVVPPRDPEPIALWITARYDAPRRGTVAGRLPGLRPWLAACALVVAAAAAARVAGAEGLAVGLVQFVPTIVLLVAVAAATDVALSGVSPGAGDNAAGVAAAIELHDELSRLPPGSLSPALLLYGAGEGDPLALRAQVRTDRLTGRDNVVLELRGAEEDPRWATRHPQLRLACEGAGGRRVRGGSLGLGDLPTVVIGGPGALSRSAGDLPETVGDKALEATVGFALAVVEGLDAELAAHETTLPQAQTPA